MTDDRFERELRGFFAGRARVSASASLRDRVASVAADAPIAPARWRTPSVHAWRGAAGLIAAAAVAVVVIALLSQPGQTTIRDGETVGGPSSITVPAGPSFIAAPDGFFTATALAEADERLRRVFAETGVEATFIVRSTPGLDQLTTPEGWPYGYDRDGDGRRDLTAVAGITPDDRIVCCLTITGAAIDQARENLYWQPIDQPSALDDELSAATPADRDAALGHFVRGVEGLATGIGVLGNEPHPTDTLMRLMPAVLLLALAGLAMAAIPRRRLAAVTPADGEDVGPEDAAGDASTTLETVSRSAESAHAHASDRRFLFVALGAFAALTVSMLVDVARVPDAQVQFDPTRDTVGIAEPGLPVVVPAIVASIALIALMAYALQGGWRRRLGMAAALVLIGGSAWLAVGETRPTGRDQDVTWASSPNGKVESHMMGGLSEVLSYDLSPGETFTLAGVVRNTGSLPLTILGLESVRPTGANPYVASIVGLGWVPQPVDDGRVHLLSAAPESASAGWPITLAPGEEAAIVILGRAGECAESGGTGSVLPLTRFSITYRVLGIERTDEVALPAAAFVAAKETCTVEVEGGTITYGPTP